VGEFRLLLVRGLAIALVALGVAASTAAADAWFPHPSDAQWTYKWSDTKYNPSGTTEQVTVQTQTGPSNCGWQLAWTGTTNVPLGGSGSSSGPVIAQPDDGTMCFQDQDYGLQNTDWSGSPPPINEPSLCPSGQSQCPNSLGSTLYNVIWGSRDPVVSEPLLSGSTWNATGGGSGNVTSVNQYLGVQTVKVPAFPNGVKAAAIQSQIALAGTPGDDYGSGIRTTWWVYGVGPVKLEFDHVDGSVTTAELQATNLKAATPPPDTDYFPLKPGLTNRYEWTNRKHLPRPEIDTVTVAAAVNRTAKITVRSVSGPVRAAGNYLFAVRLDGVRNTFGSTSAATLARFPRLGHGRHFFNPVDLMIFGFNPLLPAYPIVGTTWRSGSPYDYKVFGVKGITTVVGIRRVTVPAGTFDALEVRSALTQPGHRFGSGVRWMWFAPNRGLVKLVFRHRDGSTSQVVLLK
jgi:hypothetical protein